MSWHPAHRWYLDGMTAAQKRLRELRDRQSRERGRMAELSLLDSLDTETRAELDDIEKGTPDLERQLRAAATAVDTEDRAAVVETAEGDTDPERVELRSRASIGRFLLGAGKTSGAEAELQAELGLDSNQIPMEMWAPPAETRAATEKREITPAPGTTGVNLDALRPYVFAPSVVDRLMVEMPMVPSGTYATGTISTAATAGAVPKGGTGDVGDVLETAAAWTSQTTTPHRVGASLLLAAEDVAIVGVANFESILRQHISLVLSDELDDQLLNGAGATDDLEGIIHQLGGLPTAGATVASFDDFVAEFAGGIDGLWASMMSDVSLTVGVTTYRLAAQTFRDTPADGGDGAIAFADYAMGRYAGFWTNKRMPAPDSNVQTGILCRKGRSTMPTPTRLAVAPTWGYISIDDIYSGARKGQRRYVLSVLVGDVLLVQPDAYDPVVFRVAV